MGLPEQVKGPAFNLPAISLCTPSSMDLSGPCKLILTINPELLSIILLSLQVSGSALVIATLLGLPLGAALAWRRVPFRGLVISLINTGMGLPPVVAGLFLYLFLSRSGPLGSLGLLYTPSRHGHRSRPSWPAPSSPPSPTPPSSRWTR